MIHDTQNAQISQKQDEHNIYEIMKTMCPPGYHHNDFVATHALGHMMYVRYVYANYFTINLSKLWHSPVEDLGHVYSIY